MITHQDKKQPNGRSTKKLIFSWLNLFLGVALIIWGTWYIAQEITFAQIVEALAVANFPLIVLALLVVVSTQAAKAWRWQLLFYPKEAGLTLNASFWAVMLGQFVNTVISFLRLGELARVYALYQQTSISKIRALGTLVLEKTLELITLVLTVVVLLIFVIVPDFVSEQGLTIGLAAGTAFFLLYLLAYQTQWVIRVLSYLLRLLPPALAKRLLHWSVSGLEGLAALRSKQALAQVFSTSLLIGLLSIVTPWLLFPALGLPFGLVEAALIHVGTTLASALPVPTPARLGVFEAAVMFMLSQFGLDNPALAFSYAILFHLLIVLPQVLFGAIAASRTNWRWRSALPANTPLPPSSPSNSVP